MMKSLLLILCGGFALQANAQKAQALRVNEILNSEAIADTFHIGMTCTYNLTSAKREGFVFAVRDNSALVRVNGKDCWLKSVASKNGADGGATFSLRYKNAQYNVILVLRRTKDDNDNRGIMTVTDLKSKRKVSVAVEGGCEA